MKLSKFLSVVGFITFFSILYVHQQTEILRLAYAGQKRIVCLEDLLDKNSILRYNINKSGSLVRIGSRISERADFQMPESYRLLRFASTKRSFSVSSRVFKKESVLSRLFGIKRQAEAKTINP